MHTTRLTVIDDDPAALDTLWEALEPEPDLALPRIRAVMISTVVLPSTGVAAGSAPRPTGSSTTPCAPGPTW